MLHCKIKYFAPVIVAAFVFASCALPALSDVDEKTLTIFSRAHGIYAEGLLKETAEMLLPKNTGGKAQRFIPLLVLRGKAEYFSGDITSAVKTFRKILKLKPAQVEAQLYLARSLREKDKSAEARKIVEDLLSCDPNNIQALRLAAELAKERGDQGDASAVAFLDRAAFVSKENAYIFLDRAREYWAMGNGEKSLNDIRIAKALVSQTDPAARVLANLENTITTVIEKNNDKKNINNKKINNN
ncbi:MAG: hypothetical protein Ta2F_04310 [Termitinemataceae bacterium]|nr:MAG: hypothetical protein Ta2F_04310 [Termitinemataceae bacterium]